MFIDDIAFIQQVSVMNPKNASGFIPGGVFQLNR